MMKKKKKKKLLMMKVINIKMVEKEGKHVITKIEQKLIWTTKVMMTTTTMMLTIVKQNKIMVVEWMDIIMAIKRSIGNEDDKSKAREKLEIYWMRLSRMMILKM